MPLASASEGSHQPNPKSVTLEHCARASHTVTTPDEGYVETDAAAGPCTAKLTSSQAHGLKHGLPVVGICCQQLPTHGVGPQ